MTSKQRSELHVSRDAKIVFLPSGKRGSLDLKKAVKTYARQRIIENPPKLLLKSRCYRNFHY